MKNSDSAVVTMVLRLGSSSIRDNSPVGGDIRGGVDIRGGRDGGG